jgi:spermidine synthase
MPRKKQGVDFFRSLCGNRKLFYLRKWASFLTINTLISYNRIQLCGLFNGLCAENFIMRVTMSKLILLPIYFFAFLTGAAGLIYEVSWQKYLSRILGSDTIATSIILATFLGGLSAGYYLCGKLTVKVKNHFKAYALLEGIIGVWGLFFPVIFSAVDSATRSWSFSSPFLIVLQGLLCSGVLLGIPTICMGGTIPFLTRGISQNIEEATAVHASVYGINTAGAFIGTLAAGFFMIPGLGLPLTVMETALLNFSAALFFYLISAKITSREVEIESSSTREENAPSYGTLTSFRYPPRILYIVAFLSGFYVMTLENVLIRFVNLSIGSSSYSFTMIISVFVLAIAIGSYAVGRLKNLSRHVLFFNQLFIAMFLFLLYLSIDTWPYWAHLIRISIQSNIAGFWVYYANVFLMLTLFLILPVSFMGATVPITFHEIKRDLAHVGRHSGSLFSWNTIGNLIGSLVGGIIFFYVFDLPSIFSVAIFLAALSACLAAWKLSKKYFGLAVLLSAVSLVFVLTTPFYDITHFMIGIFRFHNPLSFSMSGPHEFFKQLMGSRISKFHKDGVMASVDVIERPEMLDLNGNKPLAIFINGKSDSSTYGDIYTLKLSAHLPALLAAQRKNVMVIGMGTGVTAGELTLYPDIERIDVAEISKTVVEALPYFSQSTYHVHNNPKLKIHIGDAFRILGRTRKKWDIIISEPSNPWVTGVDLLFTKEFYGLAKEHLSSDGILLQWVQIYDANIQMVGMIANTVMQAFQRCHVFMASPTDLLIIATDKEFTHQDIERAENMLEENPAVRSSLATIHLSSLDTILLRELWPTSYIRTFFSDFGIQTMDHPRLHYMAGKMFFLGFRMDKNILLNPASVPYISDYLLVKKYPAWAEMKLDSELLNSFLKSTENLISGDQFLMAPSVKLKAYLTYPDRFLLTNQDKEFFMVDLISIITGKTHGEGAWRKIGLQGASYRRKAEVMLSHINQHRDWIIPYSIDGLKAFLKEGMIKGVDVYEKNWCALQIAFLVTYEGADTERIKTVLDNLERDKNGQVFLRKADEGIWELIEKWLKRSAGP